MTASRPSTTPGAKMMYLIKRKPTTTREELIAHWFANHMPAVIARNGQNRAAGKLHAEHYVATLFDPKPDKPHEWDGVAQLWYERALPRPRSPHGEEPTAASGSGRLLPGQRCLKALRGYLAATALSQ